MEFDSSLEVALSTNSNLALVQRWRTMSPNASGFKRNDWEWKPSLVALRDHRWVRACCSGFL
jgi:hypothetical protein